jgi:flagellar motor switch protein FliG
MRGRTPNRLNAAREHMPGDDAFAFLSKVEPARLAAELAKESPQTIAAIVTRLDRPRAAKLIGQLPGPLKSQVAAALSRTNPTPPDVVGEIAEALRERLYREEDAQPSGPGMIRYGGPEVAANILRHAPPHVKDNLKNEDPQLFEKLRQLMYTFDDFLQSPDRTLQVVFSEAETGQIALALRVAVPKLTERVLRNMSDRRAALVRDEMERRDRVRMRDIDQARQNIVDRAVELQRAGKVLLSEEDDIVT